MKTTKVAIIGLGHIGKRHFQILTNDPRFEVIALADSQVKTHEGYQVYQDHLSLFDAHPDLDLVSVCTPNYLHDSISQDALNDGYHVLCEKPIALSRKSAESMINAALNQSRSIFCMMQNRYSPISLWLKEVVDSGALGEIYQTNVTGYWNRDERYYNPSDWKGSKEKDGGTLFTQFAHYVDMLYWLYGDLTIRGAQFENYSHQETIEFEDSGNFQFGFGNRGMGNFQYSTSTWDRNFESSITLLGEKGTVKVGGQYMDKIVYCHIKDYEMPNLVTRSNIENMALVYDNIHAVLSQTSKVMTNAMDGLKVVDIIERIYGQSHSH